MVCDSLKAAKFAWTIAYAPHSNLFDTSEAAKDLDDRPSSKEKHDHRKLARHLSGIIVAAKTKTGTQFNSSSGNKLLGCFVPRTTFSLHSLSHRGHVSCVYPIGQRLEIPSSQRGIGKSLEVLKFEVRIRIHFDNIIAKCFEFIEGLQSNEDTTFPLFGTPDQSKKSKTIHGRTNPNKSNIENSRTTKGGKLDRVFARSVPPYSESSRPITFVILRIFT